MSVDGLSVRRTRHHGVTALHIAGQLTSATYLTARNAIVATATETTGAVVVDARSVRAASDSAWSALSSAAWLVRDWPDVPVAVVADDVARHQLDAVGVTRHITVYADLETALDSVRSENMPVRVTHRSRHLVPRGIAMPIGAARHFVASTLRDWHRPRYVELARMMTTVLVSNVIEHTRDDPVVRVELHAPARLVVAVGDSDPHLPAVTEDRHGHVPIASGLALLTSLSHHWGCTPTDAGKTVWAVAGDREVERFG